MESLGFDTYARRIVFRIGGGSRRQDVTACDGKPGTRLRNSACIDLRNSGDQADVWGLHGLSGSGKSTLSQNLLESMGTIRLRSDIERKRLFGLSPDLRRAREVKMELYGSDTTDALYHHLRNTAQRLLSSGYTVIVDATFLKRHYRDLFRRLAEEEAVPFLILDVQSSLATLQERITTRKEQQSDASEADLAVLQEQQRQQEPLEQDEQTVTLRINSEEPFDPQKVIHALRNKSE